MHRSINHLRDNTGFRPVSCAIITLILLQACGCATLPSASPPAMTVTGERMPEPVPCRVYTPPGWDGATPLRLVILLHDRGENGSSFEKRGVIASLSARMSSGVIPPALLAVPETADGYWWNWHNRSRMVSDFLMMDLIPALAERYPLLPTSDALHLFGVGTGAMAAVELPARYPGVFFTVGALNGIYFDATGAADYARESINSRFESVFGPPTNPEAMTDHSVFDLIRSAGDVPITRFVLGSLSTGSWRILESNDLLRQHLFKLQIPHDVVDFFSTPRSKSLPAAMAVVIAVQLGQTEISGEIDGNPYQVFKSR